MDELISDTTIVEPIATLVNNNQPGWTNIIETAPGVTIDVGTTLYIARTRATPKAGERYRHFKGNVYEVLAIARENDLQVDFVVHKGLHDGRAWTRTLVNFLGDRDGVTRFEKVSSAS